MVVSEENKKDSTESVSKEEYVRESVCILQQILQRVEEATSKQIHVNHVLS